MENIQIEIVETKAIVKFVGSIDSSNALIFGDEIEKSLQNCHIFEIDFDFSNVTYISSAGLRLILTLSKKYEKIVVEETNPDVYEIFDMTGFTSLFKVNKKMREISIEGLECIGEGSVGKVYRLDDDTIVKVFVNADSLNDVYRERELAKRAFVYGAPTAISFDVVKIKEGGYYGAIFEMIKSESYQKLFIEHPENENKYIKENIELFKKITSTDVDVDSFPNKKKETEEWFRVLKDNEAYDLPTLNKIDSLFNSIPDVHKLVHGDLHIKNLMKQNDEVVIVDMDTIGYGHQIFELSAIFLAYVAYNETDSDNAMNFMGISNETCHKIYYSILHGVFSEKSEIEIQEIAEKCELFSYINLTYKVLMWETKGNARYNHAKAKVLSLIDKYDSLNF